jgi:hypothetical protein
MPKIAQALLLLLVLCGAAGCAGPGNGSGPAIYYENEKHHGYPGPGVTDPSAI